MNVGDEIDKVSRVAWVFSSILFLLLLSVILLSKEEIISAFGGHSFWQVSIYEKTLRTMEICFGALSLLQFALYLSARRAAAKSTISESLNAQVIGTHSVALSAWLTYAIFYGVAPISASFSVKIMLFAFFAYTILAVLRTYSEANNRRTVELLGNVAKKYASALMLFGVGLIIYLSFLSCSLSEWDSFNFAQALERFDLGAHQPHPPGYSLYVFLSQMAYAVAGERLVALASVSAISGALCLLPIYAIVKKMHDHETALVTCLALMSTRMYWLSSEKAVTHMFGTLLMTLAVCFLYFGLEGERRYFLMSWPIVGLALGARPSYFPFLGLWIYATIRDRNVKRLSMYFALFACATLSWFVPTVLLTGWERFWELIRRQYVYVFVNEFVGARYGMQPAERLLFMLDNFLSQGFGAPTWLWYFPAHPFGLQDISSAVILCLLFALMILGVAPGLRGKWNSKRTFLVLWIVPYFVVYLVSTPGYPRYFLPVIPPIVITLVPTAWSTARSIGDPSVKSTLKKRMLFGLVAALIFFNFLQSGRLATTIHTTKVPMGQLTQYIKDNYDKNTVVIVFHEYEAFEYRLPDYRYLSAQYHNSLVMKILRSLLKNSQTVLITDTAIQYVLGPEIERLGLEKTEIAKFEMDPLVETEQHVIVLYKLLSRR